MSRRENVLLVIGVLAAVLALGWAQVTTAQRTVTTETWMDPSELLARADSHNVDLIGQLGGAPPGVAVQGSYAYVGIGPRLVILDIVNPGEPLKVGETTVMPAKVSGVTVNGAYAYVAADSAGIRIVRVADPGNPVEVSHCDTPSWARNVKVGGAYAFVTDPWGGLRVISIANPASPVQVGFCDTPGSAWDVAVSNSDAYVADGAAGLRMISVANPVNPVKFEFNFRDAKEYWGFKDFMNVEKTQVTNAINLSFFMVNISRRLLRDFRCHQPEANVLDLKTFFLSRRYVTEVIKILGEKPDTILIQDVFDKIAKLGAIH